MVYALKFTLQLFYYYEIIFWQIERRKIRIVLCQRGVQLTWFPGPLEWIVEEQQTFNILLLDEEGLGTQLKFRSVFQVHV